MALLLATAISLTLSNLGGTSRTWLALWSTPLPFSVAGHALSPRGWVNEGLMAVFFFVVGLEIKQEIALGLGSGLGLGLGLGLGIRVRGGV